MNRRTGQQKQNGVIIMRLQEGLGNQLFQYALGKQLSIIHKRPLKLDISHFTQTDPDPRKGIRIYCLEHFNIQAHIAEPEDTAPFQKYLKNNLYGKVWRRTGRLVKYYKRSCIIEPPGKFCFFDHRLFTGSLKANVYLVGYWQTEKYFTSIENIIRNDFILKDVSDEVNRKMLAEIDSNASSSVGIHVRHGDNATPKASQHGVLPLSYYHKAIEDLNKTVKSPHFYVFSDDPEWAKENLHLEFPSTFVSHNGDEKNYEDLRLMSHCRHHITGNSTFSWWGAWLGKKPGQLVYAPNRYYININIPTYDFYPASWKLIEI
jgi:hypothetical protein